MFATFTYERFYNNSKEWEVIMKADKRNSQERRFCMCSNEADAIACVRALNASYNWKPAPNTGITEYWEKV